VVRILKRSRAYVESRYGKDTIGHVSSKGTITLSPSATKEDLEHEKSHFELGITRDISESNSYKKYLGDEFKAWLRAGEHLGKLNTEFVFRVSSNALDYGGATPIKVLRETSRLLKGTEYELNKREKKWLLKMLKAVGD
jgi:hypothetical protein